MVTRRPPTSGDGPPAGAWRARSRRHAASERASVPTAASRYSCGVRRAPALKQTSSRSPPGPVAGSSRSA
ncbi:hypothetical protein MF672_043650 [Actinomadura sp. ATCC 31491]|uniref:Uncharacterized protein n=1 Tax=Actinomadura luzonensis TaxID=2805427 RepID=A0ABT0G8A9_9ACTN|nr:hypothetical protein [Actinomadura luzonensis]MCK2220653.1 hypothetical protein [Actinomadura luzonensis]